MLYDSPFILAYVLVIAALLGLVMGSFINCWAWRSLRGESVIRGRSHCATCGHELAARDLIPVVSWLAAGGKCRYCGERISPRYLAAEVVCAVVYVAIVARYGLTLETIELLAFATILLFLSLTDLDEFIIPNGCIIAAIVVRFLYLLGMWALNGEAGVQPIIDSLIGGVVLGGALLLVTLIGDKVLKRPSMGGGDIKLFFVAGLYFGWQQGIFLVIVACIIGIVAAFAAPSRRALPDDDAGADAGSDDDSATRGHIPFGPSIAAACIITMLVGQPFITWYMSLLGL